MHGEHLDYQILGLDVISKMVKMDIFCFENEQFKMQMQKSFVP